MTVPRRIDCARLADAVGTVVIVRVYRFASAWVDRRGEKVAKDCAAFSDIGEVGEIPARAAGQGLCSRSPAERGNALVGNASATMSR